MFGDQIGTVNGLEVVNCVDVPDAGIAIIREGGIYLEGVFTDGVGVSWEGLARILRHPTVQEHLDEEQLSSTD